MIDFDRQPARDDFRLIHERLGAERPSASDLELDRIKLRAITRTSRRGPPQSRRLVYPRRLLVAMLALGILGGGTGGFAAAGGPKSASSRGSAAHSQYKPGKGCGDKNHRHERESECKKPVK